MFNMFLPTTFDLWTLLWTLIFSHRMNLSWKYLKHKAHLRTSFKFCDWFKLQKKSKRILCAYSSWLLHSPFAFSGRLGLKLQVILKEKKNSIYTIPLLFMFTTRININKWEINKIWKFSLTPLLIENQTICVQKHSSLNCFALHLEQLSSFVNVFQKVWPFSWQRKFRQKKGFSQNRNSDDWINF